MILIDKLFHAGDIVRMKSKEEVTKLIKQYLGNANDEYIYEVTELCDKIYTVDQIHDESYCNLNTYSVMLEEPETQIGWKLLQDYFEPYIKPEIDDMIPDLFG